MRSLRRFFFAPVPQGPNGPCWAAHLAKKSFQFGLFKNTETQEVPCFPTEQFSGRHSWVLNAQTNKPAPSEPIPNPRRKKCKQKIPLQTFGEFKLTSDLPPPLPHPQRKHTKTTKQITSKKKNARSPAPENLLAQWPQSRAAAWANRPWSAAASPVWRFRREGNQKGNQKGKTKLKMAKIRCRPTVCLL